MRVCIRFLGRWAPADSSGAGSSWEAEPSVVGDGGGLIFSIFPAMIWKRMTISKLRTHKLFTKDDSWRSIFSRSWMKKQFGMKSMKQSGKSGLSWTLKKSLPLPVTHYIKTLKNLFTKPPFTKVPAWNTPVSSYRIHFCNLEVFVRFWKITRWFFSCSANATYRDHARDIQRCLVKHSCLIFFQCFLSACVARRALGWSPMLLFPAAVSCWFHRVLLEQSRIRSLFYKLLV